MHARKQINIHNYSVMILSLIIGTRIRRPKKLHIKKQRNAAPKVQNKKEVARRPSYRQLYQIRRTNGDIISQVGVCFSVCKLFLHVYIKCVQIKIV